MTVLLRAAGAMPLLDQGRERELLTDWQENGAREALEELIVSHERMVLSVVAKMGAGIQDREELISEGYLGLIKAANLFDLDRDVRFSTYARWWVRNHVTTTYMRLRTIVDGPRGTTRGVGRNLAPVTSDNDLVDELHCPEKTAEEQLINKSDSESARKSIVDAMQELSSFEREIIIARNLQTPSATIDVLSKRFGVSGERLRQIERRAMSRLKYELLCRGVTSFRVM
ncbi:sigma-70 family RNA polymerase sigma factor [Roseovarius indicus]|uniref:sigma-70 family RNA polymerase sigma factor n=1 Tax=Roseovarius indicus TaxID=540747 RepID=UPI0007D9229A|nr:sigma-70 family RNA polymerase sigma factor [Roseovarius indicus]OAN98668.1 hypothetical protein A8B76_01090 [Roseovarius indicus]